jgi:hypothetical protein
LTAVYLEVLDGASGRFGLNPRDRTSISELQRLQFLRNRLEQRSEKRKGIG